MKNKFKIFIAVLITAIICISSTVYASYSYFAKDIGFIPKNKEWNVNNLEDAINDLYTTCKSGSLSTSEYTLNYFDKTFTELYDTNIELYSIVNQLNKKAKVRIKGSFYTNVLYDEGYVDFYINEDKVKTVYLPFKNAKEIDEIFEINPNDKFIIRENWDNKHTNCTFNLKGSILIY